ncbi:MAG TPA: hypothetical protein VII11_08970, partial [Bacteroidota bacterium]
MLLLALCSFLPAQQLHHFDIKSPTLVLSDVNFKLEVTAKDSSGATVSSLNDSLIVSGVQRNVFGKLLPAVARFSNGSAVIEDAVIPQTGSATVRASLGDVSATSTVRVIPGVLSILPPLLAILLALVMRQVVISLFAGIWLGAVFIFEYNIVGGMFRVLDHFIVAALTETSHVQIIVFSMMFGGMVGVISSNGGTVGIAN